MKSVIPTFALSMLALMLASCSSQPGTTITTTPRQTTTTTNAAENRMSQPTGYHDLQSGSADPTGGSGF
jgi:uncharacterized lipoprotein YajG